MTKPSYTLLWMGAYLAIVGVVCTLLYQPLAEAFMANWVFNLLISGVLLIGIIINISHVVMLEPEVNWIKMFRTGQAGLSIAEEPRLLKPLAKTLGNRVKDRFSMSALSLRTVLDGIRSRLDESREISRYIIGTLIFLGLLGTFWGLLGTIGSVGKIIGTLEVGTGGDFAKIFGELKAGLEQPLADMGTAFSSSLFGLGGSLVLGFVDIQAGHAQNRFFNGLEEWLSSVTQFLTDGAEVDEELEDEPPELGTPVAEGNDIASLIQEMRAERELMQQVLQELKKP